MKLTQLALERYGAFTDRVLTFDADAALHIVHGANETGKTSTLSAIGDLLFGFGARTTYNFKHDNNALRIGGTLHHSDGRQLVIRVVVPPELLDIDNLAVYPVRHPQ